jgi:hypothetical protein
MYVPNFLIVMYVPNFLIVMHVPNFLIVMYVHNFLIVMYVPNFSIVMHVPNFLIVMYVPFSVLCVLFVCKCVLDYCHRGSTHLQLNRYHTISYHIITQRVVVIPYRRFGKTCRSHLQGSITQESEV